jgi:hypothetical protein
MYQIGVQILKFNHKLNLKMKGKFKFSNISKDEKSKETNHMESEVFNINELKKYYADFTEKSKSKN